MRAKKTNKPDIDQINADNDTDTHSIHSINETESTHGVETAIPSTSSPKEESSHNSLHKKNEARKQEKERLNLAKLELSLDEGTYIVFDLETTGGNPEKNCIMEISALKYRGNEVVDRFYSMVNPRMAIPPFVRRITGITQNKVKDAPFIEDVFPGFLEFIGQDILVSHNAQGDLKFLVHFAAEVCQHELDNFFLCTHLLGQKLLKEAKDKSLSGLARHLNLPHEEKNLHRADEDAELTLGLFKVLLSMLKEKGYEHIKTAIRFQGDMLSGMRLGPVFDVLKLKALSSSPGIFSLTNHKGKKIFTSSVAHLKRDLGALKHLDSLPRKLLKTVLEAHQIVVEECFHIFTAMIKEADAVERQQTFPNFLLPLQWHGRFISGVHLTSHGEDFRITMGTPPAGVLASFGPLTDYKKVQNKLDRLAELCDTKLSRNRGLIIPAQYVELVNALFSGQLEDLLSSVRKQKFHLKNIFQWKNQKALSLKSQIIKKWIEIDLLEKHSSLFSKNGVQCVPHDRHGQEWEIYPVVASFPLSPKLIKVDPKSWLSEHPEGRAFVANIKELVDKKLSTHPEFDHLSLSSLLKMNAFLWMFFVQQHKREEKGRFFALESLLS